MEHHRRERMVYLGSETQAVLSKYLFRDARTHCLSAAESTVELRELRSAARTTPLSCGNRPSRKNDRGGLRGETAKRRTAECFTTGSHGQAINRACDKAFPAPELIAKCDNETIAQHTQRLTERQTVELKAWIQSQHWVSNQLRHTRGTELRKRFGLEATQVILGYAAADMTRLALASKN